jgi:hypothetical protein
MREITINVSDKAGAILADAYRITGRTLDEFAAVTMEHYVTQYRKVGAGMTGEEFHALLDRSANYLRRLRKKVRANSQVENPNKRPALRVIR